MTVPDSSSEVTAPAQPGEAVWWYRMSDADLKTYGGPEWVALDVGKLYNLPSTKLEDYERETGIPIFLLLFELPTYGSRATRMALFIGRREAGIKERWADFDPHTMQVKRREQPPEDAAAAAAKGNGRGKQPGTKAGTRVRPRRANQSAT